MVFCPLMARAEKLNEAKRRPPVYAAYSTGVLFSGSYSRQADGLAKKKKKE